MQSAAELATFPCAYSTAEDLVARTHLQLTGATIVPPGSMARVVSLIEQGLLKPVLAVSFPLAQFAEAQEAFMQKTHVGNIVVTI